MTPITSRYIRSNVLSSDYRKQSAKRGDRDYRVSRSDLIKIVENAHKWRAGHSEEDTDSTDWGSMVDAALFGQFASGYEAMPDTFTDKDGEEKPWDLKSPKRRAVRDAIIEAGKIPVKRFEIDRCDIAVGILREDWDVKNLLSGATTQVLLHGEYRDRATGLEIPVKALIDIVPDIKSELCLNCEGGMAFSPANTLADLKTTGDASKEAWPRYVMKWGCHIQAAFYLDLYQAATGEDRETFLHLIQESKPPYEIGRRIISAEFVQLGRGFYRMALEKYARCLTSNQWPGYDEGWSICEPEAWMVEETMGGMSRL